MSDPVLYTQAACDDCRRVQAWLTEHSAVFTERNVTGGVEAAKALLAIGTFATPLLVVGDRTVLGFRPDELADARSDARKAGAGIRVVFGREPPCTCRAA